MNKLCKTDTQTSGKFYPYKGTPIRRMLIEKGLLKEEKEKELLKGYDLNSLTDYKSVLDFESIDTDLNAEILNKLSLLFGTYVIWPVKLWPLIDIIKNSNVKDDKFVSLLWEKINDVTYYKKFKKWPINFNNFNHPIQRSLYEFENMDANEFGDILLSIWGNIEIEKINNLLEKIKNNILTPDFPVPEDDAGLKHFLGIKKITEEQKRVIRQELRDIAKKDSEVYI